MKVRLAVPKESDYDYFDVDSLEDAKEKAEKLGYELDEVHVQYKLEPGDEGYDDAGWEIDTDEDGNELSLADELDELDDEEDGDEEDEEEEED